MLSHPSPMSDGGKSERCPKRALGDKDGVFDDGGAERSRTANHRVASCALRAEARSP